MNNERMNTNKKMNNLRIGDRVKVIFADKLIKTTKDKIINGAIGTVKDTSRFGSIGFIGVEFDDDIGGNTGSWNGKNGHCEYVANAYLEKIEDTDERMDTERMSNDKVMINHPPHYTAGKVECIDAIESATGDLTGIEAVCTGNVIKYVWRWKLKNGVEDLEKASWYLNKLIKEVKGDKNAYAEDGQIDEVEK